WQVPGGIQQEEIDPATGLLAKADSANKRTELFINGTAPGSEGAAPNEDMADQTTYGTEQETPQTEPASLPPELPPAPPKTKPTPKSKEVYDDDSPTKLQGTITLDIDPTTGLIAVDSCPVIRTKTFIIGQEPKKYCGPEYHKKNQPAPQPNSRARVVNPR